MTITSVTRGAPFVTPLAAGVGTGLPRQQSQRYGQKPRPRQLPAESAETTAADGEPTGSGRIDIYI